MRVLTLFILALFATRAHAQPLSEKELLLKKLTMGTTVPDKLLSMRSIVLFDKSITQAELEETQKMFQQTGIDAVAYFNVSRALAGPDLKITFTKYLVNRNIGFLIFFEKGKELSLTFVPFNNNRDLVNDGAPAWRETHSSLEELTRNVYRACVYSQKKQNMLINDVPETDVELKVFNSRRFENFSNDVKSFKVAVPKWGNEKADAELEQILKENFPGKWELVDPMMEERELTNRGFIIVLRFIHTEGEEARNILEYDPAQLAKSLTSVVYINGEADLKTIPANQVVYKFYFKHIEYGNIFLGKGWDADLTWQDALRNHLLGMREALKF